MHIKVQYIYKFIYLFIYFLFYFLIKVGKKGYFNVCVCVSSLDVDWRWWSQFTGVGEYTSYHTTP